MEGGNLFSGGGGVVFAFGVVGVGVLWGGGGGGGGGGLFWGCGCVGGGGWGGVGGAPQSLGRRGGGGKVGWGKKMGGGE